ncbi:MAG: TolB family protein, partial [Leptospirillia bacterium]
DIYLRDTQANTTAWVSVDANGLQADGASRNPSVSGDGRYVAFESDATDIDAGDDNGLTDIYLRDTQANTTAWISMNSQGFAANGASTRPAISGDGLWVVFVSLATDLVSTDTNGGVADIFLHDVMGGTTTRLSDGPLSSPLDEADGSSDRPVLSTDGSAVAFESLATNLVTGDGNGVSDIFFDTLP